MKMFLVMFLVHILHSGQAADLPWDTDNGLFDEVPDEMMIQNGDIYIGFILQISDYSPHRLCSNRIVPSRLQFSLMAEYGMKLVNENEHILPNITLGMVVVDDCKKPLTSMGQAIKFLPIKNNGAIYPPVVGVIGPYSSGPSSYVAGVFNIFQIPMVSPLAVSDELSDRSRYGNFFRVVTPNSHKAEAVVDFLSYFNWTYISVIYMETAYGFNSLILMRKHLKNTGICIGYSYSISDQAVDEDYELLVSQLLSDQKARVLVLFMGGFDTSVTGLFKAAGKFGAEKIFTYFFADGTNHRNMVPFSPFLHGALYVKFYTTTYPGYQSYMENLSPKAAPYNPWLVKVWKDYFSCKLPDIFNLSHECSQKTVKDIPGYYFHKTPTIMVPSIYGQAIHALIQEHCPDASFNKTRLLDCVKPALLIQYLKSTVYTTDTGLERFDETGALLQGYVFLQARVDVKTTEVSFHEVGSWKRGNLRLQETKMWKTGGEGYSMNIPTSICALPCELGKFLVQGELACCWDCFKCRDNEYVSDNGTSCSPCPYAHWPDQETFLGCVSIEPSFLWWTDKYGIGLTVLAGLGIVISIGLVIIMRLNQDRKVIKGSSINMMLVINSGLLMMFINVLLFIARPSFYLCLASRVAFNLSCILVFAPLLMKTNRLYQIFKASSKLMPIHPTAGANVSAVLTGLTIASEGVIIAVCLYLWPVDANISMPVLTTRYAELSCEQDMIGLLIPLCYNILILLICSIFAFLTRALPDNFNESWYILLSVSATLFVWMTFLPTYFSAFYASHKVALLGLALVLNGLITIVCFFATKFYALFFIDEKDIKVTNFNTHTFELEPSKSETGNDALND